MGPYLCAVLLFHETVIVLEVRSTTGKLPTFDSLGAFHLVLHLSFSAEVGVWCGAAHAAPHHPLPQN